MSVQDWMPPGVDKYEYSERYFGTDRTQPAKRFTEPLPPEPLPPETWRQRLASVLERTVHWLRQ